MHISIRAIATAIAIAVVTSLFSLVAAPLLALPPTGAAYAQEGPRIEYELDAAGMVVEGSGVGFGLTANSQGNGRENVVQNMMDFSEFTQGDDLSAPPATIPPPGTVRGYGQRHNTGYEHVGNQALQIFGRVEVSYPENDTGPVAEYTAKDADGDEITWSLLGYDRQKFVISGEGVLRFRSPPDFENPKGMGGNTYWVIIQAEDDGRPSEYDVHNVRITVTQVNELGELSGDAEIAQPENSIKTVAQYHVQDPENGTITWSLSGPDADAFQIDEQGKLSPAVALDFENVTSSDGSNVHTMTVTATDDGTPELSTQLDVSITLTNVNEAPSVGSIPGVELSTEDLPWLIDLGMYFADPDGDSLTYGISGNNITDVALAHLESGTLSIDSVGEGGMSFYVVATDPGGMRAITSVSVSVTESGPDPSLPAPVDTLTPMVSEAVTGVSYASLPPIVERRIGNQTQESDSVSRAIVGFVLEPLEQPTTEVSLPPYVEPPAPQKVSTIVNVAARHNQAPLSALMVGSVGDRTTFTAWQAILLMLIVMIPSGYAVRMYVIHRL